MKRIIIGALVASLIFFFYQMTMWMNVHKPFEYSPGQDTILSLLDQHLEKNGMYMMPAVDPNDPEISEKQDEFYKSKIGKPYVIINFNKAMDEFSASYIIYGYLCTLLACIIACIVVYRVNLMTFGGRFWIAMAFGLFTVFQGALDEMNWWSLPWKYVMPQVIDLTVGWSLTCLWIAKYVRRVM